MFYLVTGAAASGKSTMIKMLKNRFDRLVCHDFDEKAASTAEDRCNILEEWLIEALNHQNKGKDFLIAAHSPFGELLAAPSAIKLNAICACLLDCNDFERATRYRLRPQMEEWPLNQDTLCWASWQRMHSIDPQWEQRVIINNNTAFHWERWNRWKSDDERWKVKVIDTSHDGIEKTLDSLTDWIVSEKNGKQLLTIDSNWWNK